MKVNEELTSPLYDLVILVVLYGKEIIESSSCKACIEFLEINNTHKVKLVIWNNGPEDVSFFTESDVTIFNRLENPPLSNIYNYIQAQYSAVNYAFFDDDSLIGESYFNYMLVNKSITIPNIISEGRHLYPSSIGNNSFMSILSGLVINQEVACLIRKEYGCLFDTHFCFYGIDTSFYYRVAKLKVVTKVAGSINHSLSKHQPETSEKKKWREIERAKDIGVRVRRYPSIQSLKDMLYKVLKLIQKKDFYLIYLIIKFIFVGKHDRSKKSI